jgi:alpha-D-xyloside xylohydrolase
MSVFHFDCFWMREFNWCDFAWDTRQFPDPQGMLARLKARRPAGQRVDQSVHRPALAALRRGAWPGLPPEATERRRLAVGPLAAGHGPRRLHEPGGAPLVCGQAATPCWTWASTASRPTSASAFPPTSPTSTAPIPSGCTTTTPTCTTELVFEVLEERRGKGEAVVFARSATAGQPAVPGPLGRGLHATFESMAESLRGGLSLGSVGLRLLEPRHRRVRRNALGVGLQALDRLRPALLAQPAPCKRVLPRAVAVRR